MSDSALITRVHRLLDDGYVLFARAVDGQFEVVLSSPDESSPAFPGIGNDLETAVERAAVFEQQVHRRRREALEGLRTMSTLLYGFGEAGPDDRAAIGSAPV